MKTNNKTAKCYKSINWKQCVNELSQLQYEILIAYRANDMKRVQRIQTQLTRSFSARALAVRKVTSNSGRNTPGIDGIIWNRPEQKFSAILDLKDLSRYKATPVKRRYISKTDGKLRPLGIPTMMDRAVQTLHMFTIDPIAEETACQRSYGYRLHRGVHDNAIYLKLVLGNYTATRRYILEADIKGFFPSVSHKWLLDNIPMNKAILKEFLKAGVMEDSFLHSTLDGFPQGSPISPALANMTLNGLGDILVRNGFLYTRYADDFVVLGKTKEELNEVARPLIKGFLAERGLVLHPEKTGLCGIEEGFDFLGFHFREYPDERRAKGTKRGIFLVTPSRAKVNSFCRKLRSLIKNHNEKSFYLLVRKLNSMLRGWAEHYRKVTSQRAFRTIHACVWRALWKKLRRKHRRRSKGWLFQRYFRRHKGNKWVFVADSGRKTEISLFQIPYVPIRYHSLNSSYNAYDLEVNEVFVKSTKARSASALRESNVVSYLTKKQRGVCPVCTQTLFIDEELKIVAKKAGTFGADGRKRTIDGTLVHENCAHAYTEEPS